MKGGGVVKSRIFKNMQLGGRIAGHIFLVIFIIKIYYTILATSQYKLFRTPGILI